jgi:hypothetical protein
VPADVVPASRAWLSDRPSWCVDHGVTLEAMTTCDLWLALARGDVTPETKVWREGMPYWDRVANVPEFALALPGSSVWDGAPASGTRRAGGERAQAEAADGAAGHAVGGAAARMEYGQIHMEDGPFSDARPAGSAAGSAAPFAGEPMADESVTTGQACDLVTPAPVVVEEKETVRPPSRARKRALPRLDRASALSVAIGATLAVLALTLATTAPAPGQNKAPETASGHVAAGAPVRGVELPIPEASATSTTSATSTASAPDPQGAASAKARGPRPLDRGQTRSRTGTGDRRR